MIVTKTSPFTGKEQSMDLPVTQEQIDNHNNGMLAHRAFPDLPAEQREFLISGITPDEWNETIGSLEEE